MRTPQDIYTEYKIMPSLQLHQLRVAAVGKLICDNFNKLINTKDVVVAGLFHDMGNTIKFEPKQIPEFYEPEGVEYWLGVKAEYKKKYGPIPHDANVTIAGELGLSPKVIQMLDMSGFSRVRRVLESDSFELKIFQYSDMRVAPWGVRSMEERIEDGRKRYLTRKLPNTVQYFTDDGFPELLKAARELEKQIFSETTISPEDITDSSVAPFIEELREFPVA